ncbi:hypothetical protein E2C01_053729 [Portunus trituberculatus]|uniref:Uncharacterized protein n=1 Tax=Portunus trituberculatus TaxID=210409 RepID=A0A5B7GHY5_PORTR|nr:hypothetical protein [Portunus trituberculatus]
MITVTMVGGDDEGEGRRELEGVRRKVLGGCIGTVRSGGVDEGVQGSGWAGRRTIHLVDQPTRAGPL